MTTTTAVFTYYYPDGRIETRPEPVSGQGTVWIRGAYSPPVFPSPLSVRVGDSGVRVWMVIGWLKECRWDDDAVLSQYKGMLHPDDLVAAKWYYSRYAPEIDEKLREEGWVN